MNANGWRPIEEPQAFDLEPIADALRDATRHAEPEDLRADLAGEVSRWNEVTRDLEYQALNASERQEVANALLTKRIKPLKQFQRLSPTSQAHIAGLIDSGQLVPFPLPSE